MEESDGLIISSSSEEELPAAPAEEAEPPAASAPAPEAEEVEDDRPLTGRQFRRFVDRTTRQRGDLERELAAMRAQNETLMRLIQPEPQRQAEPEPSGPPRRPRPSDYNSSEDFDEAETRYISDRVAYELQQHLGQERQQQQARTQEQQDKARLDAIAAREQELAKTHQDYYTRLETLRPTLAPHVLWALQQAGERGPDFVLLLSSDAEAVDRLNQVPPHLVGLELGLLQGGRSPDRETPPANPPAPQRRSPPLQPLNGSGGTAANGQPRDDWTQEQFDAWTRKQYPQMPYTTRR